MKYWWNLAEYISLLFIFIGAGGLSFEIWQHKGKNGLPWVFHCGLVAIVSVVVLALRLRVWGAQASGPGLAILVAHAVTWMFFLRNYERYEGLSEQGQVYPE